MRIRRSTTTWDARADDRARYEQGGGAQRGIAELLRARDRQLARRRVASEEITGERRREALPPMDDNAERGRTSMAVDAASGESSAVRPSPAGPPRDGFLPASQGRAMEAQRWTSLVAHVTTVAQPAPRGEVVRMGVRTTQVFGTIGDRRQRPRRVGQQLFWVSNADRAAEWYGPGGRLTTRARDPAFDGRGARGGPLLRGRGVDTVGLFTALVAKRPRERMREIWTRAPGRVGPYRRVMRDTGSSGHDHSWSTRR